MHSPDFIQRQKGFLEQLLQTVGRSGADTKESGRALTEAKSVDDIGSATYDLELSMSLFTSGNQNLSEIYAALRRIETGVYGVCESSGEEIPAERLEVIPWTRYTVQVQAQLEKQNQGRGRGGNAFSLFDNSQSNASGDEDDGEEESDKPKKKVRDEDAEAA